MSSLRYVPLGGLGEVGMNMWALEWEGQVLVVDAGLMFPQEDMLGVDLVIPDISYLLEEGRNVVGIFLTHGHEDHIGALPFVLQRLNVPVYGTRLTLGLVRPKLREHRILRESDLREVRIGDRVRLGPFSVETVGVCHSIPDAVALAVETPVGRVVYTSDFKLDPSPPEGYPTDMHRLREIGASGVLLMLGDSTNSERQGRSGSERELLGPLAEIFTQAPGRVVVATFASNIHRIQQVVNQAVACGRRIAIVGRSLVSNVKTAQELGYLEIPEGTVVRIEDADRLADSDVVLLTAGSQGEPLSALSRFAAQRHGLVNVRRGDWVMISATPIPGNERLVHRTINNLYRHGARVFYSEVGHVHVSGHAYADELREMLLALNPRFFVPVHGEYRQLLHHADLAAEVGLDRSRVMVVEDGQAIELTADSIAAGPKIGAGFVFVDGLGIGDVEQVVLRDRRRLAEDGIVVITVAVDRDTGRLRTGPEIISRGFIEPELSQRLMDEARAAAVEAVGTAAIGQGAETRLLNETLHDAVSGVLYRRTKRRPMVIPVITEL